MFKCRKHVRLQMGLIMLKYGSVPSTSLPPRTTYLICLLVDCFIFGSPESSADLAHFNFNFLNFLGEMRTILLSHDYITFSHLNLDLLKFSHLNFFLILWHFHVTLTIEFLISLFSQSTVNTSTSFSNHLG